MPIKLGSTEYRIIAAAVLVAALSIAISAKYFWRVFPEAAIDIRVDRDESAPLAQKFLADRGFKLEGYRHAAIFSYDDETKLYLERTQGLERMNRLAHGPIHLWRWSHRWFRPQQKEEFRADVTPAGELVAFDHEIEESAAGANLDQAAARTIAERFLREVMKRDPDDLEFVEANSNKRPARTDYSFTWKQKSVSLGDGSLRLEVEVDGDQVAGLNEFVKIPEQWSRDYEKLRSRNNVAQIVDEVFWILLSVVMVGLLIKFLVDRRTLPLRLSLALGATGSVLYFLNEANTFSLALFSYQTTDSYSSFVTNYLGKSVMLALLIGALFFLLVMASEPVYREGFPRFVSLRRTFSWQGLRTRSFLMANVVGIGLTFFFFAYQTVFYLAANHLGAWAPSEPQFSDDLNTRIPWVAALFIGFIAAVSEEMQFRAFAIPFLKKLTRSWPLALVLAAFNWGFLHSAYPNQPFFIRGLEVGVGGIITGLVMLRFGVVATLIWHYSVDALYTAFLLLRSPNHYFQISGGITAGIMLVPLTVALVAYWRSGTFTDEAPLSNQNEGARPPASSPQEMAREEISAPVAAEAGAEPRTGGAPSYQPLSSSRLALAGVLLVVCAAVAMAPAYRFGRGAEASVDREQAARAADEFLRQKQAPVENYHRVAWLEDNIDPLVAQYLLERCSVQQTDAIFRQATRLVLWHVRYFRPLQKEEYVVFVDAAAGRVFSYRHVLDEDAPGATLSLDEARGLAEKALEDNGYPLAGFELQDHDTKKRKARQDYTFVWQAKAGDPRNVGDEHYRVQTEIAGDHVVAVSRYFKLPEDWERQRTGTALSNAI
ncbi:MAG TPA: CPBP family intramembrane glutamic endopeptidase, partial [Terriglobia bacterium]|nr:CPBP family intramembrane glutamic endopeptidase [Terriglobia bacterium]